MTSARTLYAQVIPMAMEMPRDSYDALTRLCRSGSAYGFAELVMPVCDHIVRLTGNGLAYGSRAIARGLTGDLAGALEDAKSYYAIECEQESDKDTTVCQKLQQRMIDFQANKNPYDAEFLGLLRDEVNGE